MLRHSGNNSNGNSPNSKHNATQSNTNNKPGKTSKKAVASASLPYWCWMICGVVISFLSIDYSMRALFPDHTIASSKDDATTTDFFLPGSTGLLSLASSRTALMDGLVDTTTPLNQVTNPDNTYAYDNIAHVKPDPNRHAILIPYRDRPFHLELFLEYMGPYLNLHFPHAHFDLWIVEQDDIELFNRAWLANVGLREIVRHAPTTSCVIFHDVDLVPNMTSHVPYTTCQWPIQLGAELQHFNWSVPYPAYAGGITSMSLKHWQLINGLGNGA